MSETKIVKTQPGMPPARTSFSTLGARITGRKLDGADKPPVLSFEVNENEWRLCATTNLPGDNVKDNDYGKINVQLGRPEFYTLLRMTRMVADGTVPSYEVTHKEFKYIGGKRSSERLDTATVSVKRNPAGVVYWVISSYNTRRPLCHFPLVDQDSWSVSIGGECNDAKAILAREMAHAICDWLANAMPTIATDYHLTRYDLKQQAEKGDGKQGNRGNNSGNYNSNQRSSSASSDGAVDFDDDLPF